ncbi:hypothetical protein IJJ08_00210 [bacterium]|nr:hypothetical protein [bacterium]
MAIAMWLTLVSQAWAADFHTRVSGEYTFSANAPTRVKLDYTLTNANAAVFVQNYQVILPESAANIVIQAKDQQITKQLHSQAGQQLVDLAFDNEVVGQGKRREFTLEYTDTSLRQKRGGSLFLHIPSLMGSEEFDSYETIVRTPLEFGRPDFVTPTPEKTGTGSGQLVYTFAPTNGQAINIGYGRQQILQFEWQQELFNRQHTPAYQVVTLPGDGPEWRVVYSSLTPEPTDWQPRTNGTWQGIYLLAAGERQQVQASGYLIYDRIDQDFDPQKAYEQLTGQIYLWDVGKTAESLPAASVSASIVGQVHRWGGLPILDRYNLSLHNHTGWVHEGLRLVVFDPSGKVKVDPLESEITLYPWQKSVIICTIRGPWWQPYTVFQLTAQLVDSQGNIIDEQKISGLSLSYLALACLGGIIGLAGVAGSLLVDGRRR